MLIIQYIVVPIVYWLDLATPTPTAISTWENVSVHGLDLALVSIEVTINNATVARTHVIPILIIAILYCFYTWVVHAIPYGSTGE